MIMHQRVALVAISLLLITGILQARQLASDTFTFRDAAQQPIMVLNDGKLESACTLTTKDRQHPATVTIDLQTSHLLHRVYWCGDRDYIGQDTPPIKRVDENAGTITLFIGETLTQMQRISVSPISTALVSKAPNAGEPETPQALLNTEADYRFPLTSARYVRLVAENAPENFAWVLGELELYGFDAKQSKARENVILVPPNAAPALSFAASELSYYLGELTGKPHPVIAAGAEADTYTGAVYRIEDLKSLAPTYEEMLKNQQEGALPAETVTIERKGREVIFCSWPYRNVILSVWEFLERQGVRWTYPDPHGDYVPANSTVALGFLPLHYTPPSARIYANFDVTKFLYGMPWNPWPMTQGYLYFWRNRWTSSWNGFPFFSNAEVPKVTEDRKNLKDEYQEGFEGYPHNFTSVVPARLFAQHPDWMGLSRDAKDPPGTRLPERTPCFTNQEMIKFVADKAAAWAALTPGVPRKINLLPMDAAKDCECDNCLALNQPFVTPDIPYCAYPTYYSSDAYFYFVCEVAKRVAKIAPEITIGALAYANVFAPPRKIAHFPDNVQVEVCMYGAMNLPLSAPANAVMQHYLAEWAKKCVRLENYDYVLLNENAKSWPMPLPLASAMKDWAVSQWKQHAFSSGTQASPEMLRFCPWNFYVYPRLRWLPVTAKPDSKSVADSLLGEFFRCNYREAGKAMLAYYRVVEDYHTKNNINLHGGGYQYHLSPGAFPYSVLCKMATRLKDAERVASSWVTKRRLVPIREGFDWLVANTGLSPEDLTTTARFPVLAPGCAPVVVNAQHADIRTGASYLLQNQRIGQVVNFTQAGKYSLTFKATGFERKQPARELIAYVGEHRFGFVDAPDGSHDYAITVTAPTGIWEVGILCPQLNGPLFVENFTIAPAPEK